MPYEKVGKNEPVCIADEVPFEIPESWEWVRLGNVIELQSGQDMTPDKYNSNGNGIPYITGASNIENGKVLINRWTNCGRAFAYKGDILLTCKGTVGTMAVLQESQVHIARQIMAIRPIGELYVSYIQLVLQTFVESLKAAAKSMIPGIARDDVLQSLFPVPPFNEQKRIVSKFSMIIPYMEQYSMVDAELSSLNNIFPETLKKSILQEAVQGKLVQQDPSDEPASVLLERIRAEKERLIQEGKIKRDKHESVIYRRDNSHYEKLDGIERCIDNEIPFEIPENWEWVRFYNIASFQNGDRSKNYPNRNEYVSNGVAWINTGHITSDGFLNVNTMNYITEEKYSSLSNGRIQKGDLVYCLRGATFGKVARIEPFSKGAIASSLMIIRPFDVSLRNYIYWYLRSPSAYIELHKYSNGSAQPNLAAKDVGKYLVPIPPLDEQIRIINKSIRLLAIIENI